MRAACSRPHRRVDWLHSETRTQKLGCPIDIAHPDFDLLDSLAKFLQVSRDGPGAARLAAGQDVEADAASELELELPGVLVGGHVGEARRTVGRADQIKIRRLDSEANGDLRNRVA